MKCGAGDFGLFLEEQSEHERAEIYFKKSIAGDSQEVSRIVNYASFLSDLGRFDESRGMYLKAMEVDASDPTLYFNFACLNAKEGLVKEALKALRVAVVDLRMEDPDFEDEDLRCLIGEIDFQEIVLAHQYLDDDTNSFPK